MTTESWTTQPALSKAEREEVISRVCGVLVPADQARMLPLADAFAKEARAKALREVVERLKCEAKFAMPVVCDQPVIAWDNATIHNLALKLEAEIKGAERS